MNNNTDLPVKPVSRITLCLDDETLAIFKAHAGMTGQSYQTLMSETLKQLACHFRQVDMLDEEIRQEDA